MVEIPWRCGSTPAELPEKRGKDAKVPQNPKEVVRKVANVSQNLEKLLGCVKIRGLAKVLQNLKRCAALSRRKYFMME